MTKCDVVKQTILHKETDRVPYGIYFTAEAEKKVLPHFPGEELQLALGNYIYRIFPPWWDWCNVPNSYMDFDAPDVLPQTRGSGNYEEFYEKCRRIKKETGCYILATIYGSHFEKANFARGIENFLADLGCNKEFAERLLSTIIRKNMVMLENLVSCPDVDGILLGSDWGSQQSLLMSPDVWRELIAPGELEEYSLIKSAGKDLWIHSCGNIEQVIPDLISMGVDVLNPLQPECMNIYEIKRKYGDKLTFWGGISTQYTLPYGTQDEVRAETRSVISMMKRNGGYISSPAQEIQDDVPLENILALIEVIKSF